MTNFLNKLAPALAALFASAFAVSATPPQPRAGEPLVGLTSAQMQRFQEGRDFYSTPLSREMGLGPAFNQPSCAACHEQPLGGWGATSVTHFGNLVGGNFNFLTALGGPVLQRQAIWPTCIEVQPSAAIANHVRVRVTPSVLAFGLVEAISDASIIALEDPNDANGDGISGRAHRVATLEDPTGAQRIGRFGWKAQIATVLSFSGDAARNEMGLTNSVVPTETAPNGNAVLLADCDSVPEIEDQPNQFGVTFVAGVTAFQRYLGPPPQSPRSGMAGEAIFNAVGCVKCHTAQFLTPNDPALEGAIRNKAMRVYSDFLLHDMGALADGIPDGQATGVEMKTPPLWNLRTRPVMLHNGSVSAGDFATKVTAAINAHAGEATASRNAFAALGATDRAAFLAFLDSLGRNDYDADSDGLITRSDFALIVRNSTDANVTADEAWAVADLNQNHLIDADEVTQLRDMLGVPVDCNQNGVADWTEIATGASDDLNANGTPDECDQSNCTARTKRVSGTGGAIPDLGGGSLTRTISVVAPTGNPAIQSMRVTLNITHTWLSDLTITLRRGSDPAITLHTGCGTFHDINGRYLLTDTAWEGAPAGLVTICGSALIDGGGTNSETRFTFTPGTFRPTQGTASTGFQSMRGQPMGAVWTLAITDSRSNDVGTLQGWSIDFRYADSNPTDCDNIGGADCAQLAANPALDCDGNGVIDTCESMSGDCDGDGVRDRCEIADGDGQDCNGNGQLDSCDIAAGIVADCNSNGVVDACELADGDGADSDSDLVLDRCERDFGDLDLDGVLSAADLALLLGAWGTPGVGFGDIGGDGIVNAEDLAFLLSNWSAVPSWAQPTLSGVTPAAGSSAGGTAITLTGTNLDGATSLTVGGAAAANLVVVSATRLTAVTPAGSTGARDIVVTTPRGVATLAGGFTYQSAPPPTISSVSPNSGSTVGATAITITGTNLTGTSAVTIGGVAATSVSVVNATMVTAVTPAGTEGAKTVSVTTPGGTASLTNGFTYVAGPTISGISPNAGVTSGGAAITITGTGFTGATGVTIGGVATQSLSVVNATTITATAPALAAGLYSVVVTTPFGVGTLANAYTAQVSLPPTISSVSPNTGPLSGGTTITITGTNLTGASSVTIDGVAATSVSVVSSTTVTAVTPAATAGAKTVSVTTPGGTASLTSGFTYISLITPSWATLVEALPDPAVVTDVTLRNAIIATGYPWRVRDNGTQIEMVLVPGGTFTMGCTASNAYACNANENPTHSVTITNAFYMGRYEVTQAQWLARMGSNPSSFQGASYPDAASRPVEMVSWNTVQGFLTATGMQLPTEAQWEYACRAGTTTAFHGFTGYLSGTNDDTLVGNIAWYGAFSGGNSDGQTHAVGGKAANALGLHDMLGNVWEWCNDWYGDYSSPAQTNPTGPATGTNRVVRGGSWDIDTYYVRSSARFESTPAITYTTLGFRAVKSPSAVAAPTISSVAPNTGPTTGGTAITVTGTNLTGTSSVTIDGVAATSVSVVNATTVTAVTPAGTVGAKTVSVTTPGGTASLTSGFTYISLITPSWATLVEALPDPAVVTDVTLRNAIIATGYPWRVRDNGTQIEMVLVPGGTFTMGCTASNSSGCNADESPTHSVMITNAFYMGRYEVTQAQWLAKMGSNPSYFQGASYPDAASRPIEQVSWNTIQGFLTATGMQLPTEAQWEYACRAGTTTAFHGFTGYLSGTNDDTLVGGIAWGLSNSGLQSHAVGGKASNTLGLHDMSGNVYEWCSDWYGPYSAGAQTNPTGSASGTARTMRGGAWFSGTGYVRSSFRDGYTPDYADNGIGFRAVKSPSAVAAPTISSVAPNTGPTTGGTAITITGTNLTGTSSVTIGGVAATSVSVVNATTVTAVTPAGTIGVKTVSITTPGGTANLTSGFTYGAGPTISSVSPNVGPTTGGTAITITGTNLTGTSSVSVSGNAATSVVVVNATTVTATTPSGAAGAANVSLTTPYGSPTASGAFTYQLYATPTISSVSPNTGPTTGGTAITITGTNLTGASSVTIGGVAATSVSVVSSTTVTAVTPAGTIGAKTVSVTTPGGTASLTSGFTYGAGPTISSVSPNVGPTTGGTAITITGTNLTGTSSVSVGGNAATSVVVVNATTVTAVTPSGAAGAANVSLTTPYGSPTASGAFTYQLYSTPTISSVSPNTGPTIGGTAITITGTNLTGASSVTIGGVAATSVSVVSSTTVTVVTPAATAGAKTVSVTTPGGTASLTSGFTYTSASVWYTVLEQNPNPAVVTDVSLRNAITATGYPWRVRDNGTGIEMLLVPGGTFTMGCTASTGSTCFPEENPTHSVTITNAFYMGRYEVTQAQWLAKMGSNPSNFQPPTYTADTSRPVERVSWNTIQGFLTATGMQLPTEAQWEYACRAGTTTAFHGFTGYLSGTNDDTLVGNIAWYATNSGNVTHAVGGKAANGLGLHDMLGNVWEWCGDWYGVYSATAQTNPTGPASGSNRVVRGGAWGNNADRVRSSHRGADTPGTANNFLGFRVARAPL